ncbi:hypothetical protein M2284_003461 [Rhodococcus sp. LBL1]|nr:hypothetical protein [Rhodococcus sp. LBL1]MDH6685015.1 hypothetical protein [Rhodococcus sp. LBL2]
MTTPTAQSRRTPTVIAVVAATIICVAAFVLSFTALTDLAARSGITVPLLWPAIVDGVVLAATVAVVAGGGRYAWLLLVAGALISVGGNVLHAALPDGVLPVWLRAVVAAVPPVALLATAHLVVVLRGAEHHATPAETADDDVEYTDVRLGDECPSVTAVEVGRGIVSPPDVDAVAEPVATPEQGQRDAVTATGDDDTRARGMELLAAGATPREVADRLGIHRATAYKWRNQIPATGLG